MQNEYIITQADSRTTNTSKNDLPKFAEIFPPKVNLSLLLVVKRSVKMRYIIKNSILVANCPEKRCGQTRTLGWMGRGRTSEATGKICCESLGRVTLAAVRAAAHLLRLVAPVALVLPWTPHLWGLLHLRQHAVLPSRHLPSLLSRPLSPWADL